MVDISQHSLMQFILEHDLHTQTHAQCQLYVYLNETDKMPRVVFIQMQTCRHTPDKENHYARTTNLPWI